MSDLFGDLRLALRSLLRSPLHSSLTVLILGVGIGAVTLMFSALNASVLRPLPFPQPERLVWLWKASDEVPQNSVSYEDFRDYRWGVEALQDLAATQLFSQRPLVTIGGEGERVLANQVTPNFFSTLGVSPELGRSFLWEEAVLGGAEVTILTHAYWQTRFGGDPAIIGKSVSMDGRATEIVGVMPQGFQFRQPVQLWVPTRDGDGATQGRGNNNFFLVGRLREGVSLEQAQAQVDGVALEIQQANPDMAMWFHWLEPLHDVLFGDVRNVLFILLGIVALVPLLACANVASLSLARATARTPELATRLALGAGRGRVLRQLGVESLVLAALGGILGLTIAFAGGSLLRSLGPGALPRLDEIGIDGPVLVFSLLVSLFTVPLFGILPALRGTDFDLARTLRQGGRGGGTRSRLRSALVVGQVALSMTLLVASGLLFRSFMSLQSLDPGFPVESLLTARIELPEFKYDDRQEMGLAWEDVLGRIRAIPGVEKAGLADWLPVNPGGGPWNAVSRSDRPLGPGETGTPASRKMVSPEYFETLGSRMLAGRSFLAEERVGTPGAMILSETLAQILFPGEDPLGRGVDLWGDQFAVVGVSADVSESGLGVVGRPTFYISASQFPQDAFDLLVRTGALEPLAVVAGIRAALRGMDPDITLAGVQTMETRVAGTLAQPRFRTGLVGVFALAGLLLAAFGLYGVLAYLVARRRHEIGIRMAVGAGSGNVVGLVLGQGLRLVGIGGALGLLGGAVASLALRGFLPGVSTGDPLTMVAASSVLLLVGVVACLLPAWKAVKVDPLEALQAE